MSDLRALLAQPVAHRGLHGAQAPENTLPAILAAARAGYGIEIDVQPAHDGTPMVFHDYDLRRLTGQVGPIAQADPADLITRPVLDSTATIPTLRSVLDALAGTAPLVIEIKDQDGALGPNLRGLEEAVIQEIAGYDGPLCLMSFNPHSVAALKAQTTRPVGLVTCGYEDDSWPMLPAATRTRLRDLPDVGPIGADFISHDHRDLASAPVAALRARGLPVLCWTIRRPEAAATALRHADAITFEGFAP